jgi:hypothetical protein
MRRHCICLVISLKKNYASLHHIFLVNLKLFLGYTIGSLTLEEVAAMNVYFEDNALIKATEACGERCQIKGQALDSE